MNLRDLEYLLALADLGRFGSAARRCGVTQPTLSTQVGKLEDELGVVLFERGPRGATPTAVGRRILAQAGVVLDEARRLHEIARQAADPLAGHFYLGVIPTVGPYLLPHLLPLLKERHANLELFLREEFTERLLERLRTVSIDAAILSLPVEDTSLRMEPIYEEDFVVALPEGHALARRRRLKVADLAGENLLLLEEGHCMRDQTLGHCGPAAERSDFQAGSIESLRQMVGAGIGATLLPALATSGPFADAAPIAVRPFQRPVPRRTIVLAWRRSLPHGPALRELARFLERRLRSAGPRPRSRPAGAARGVCR